VTDLESAETFLRDGDQDQEIHKRLVRALRKIDELKDHRRMMRDALVEAVAENVSALNLPPPVILPALHSGPHSPEECIVGLADWQLGKRTPDYSTERCAQRIERLSQKVERLTEIQRYDHAIDTCNVWLLGDLVEGELIFPGQAHRIDSSLFRQALLHGPEILGTFLRRMLLLFQYIKVEMVIGNHGALGGLSRREYHPESNADAFLYDATRRVLANEPRISWGPSVLDDERLWHRIVDVGDRRWFLFHGDQVKGYGRYPWYGFDTKIKGWFMDPQIGQFDYAMCGHFHSDCSFPVGSSTVWCSGSTESRNTWAQEYLAANRGAMQWVLYQHPTIGVTAEHRVWLE